MQPVMFGTNERRLAGLYHPPVGGYSQRAFLLCNPMGQEAIRVYRFYRELALRLSQGGAHVFRFDYFGCGDSGGGAEDLSVSGWLDDIASASRELTDTAAIDQVSLIGMRFGATLACLASPSIPGIERLVLFDPVVDGRRYLDAMDAEHGIMLQDPDRFPVPRSRDEAEGELLGFEMPGSLRQEIAAIDLCTEKPGQNIKVAVLSSAGTAGHRRLLSHLHGAGVACHDVPVPADMNWEDGTALERTLISPALLAAIIEQAAP